MAYIGKQPVVGNFVKLDAITTSATATYNLLNGGVAYFPQTANNCIVSLNGVIQSPTSAYTISGSTIVFSDALTSSDSIDFILVLGDVLSIGTPSDNSVTLNKLTATGTKDATTFLRGDNTFASAGTAWQSVQTTGFTASAGRGYPCNTTSAAFTVTLPATPSVGDTIILLDYAGTFDTNALVVSPNGNKIEGGTSNLQLSGDREGVTLTYVDATQGWLAVSGIQEGTDALAPVPYSVDFLVIAGGGSGGSDSGAGGGAGGYRNSYLTETSGGGGSSEASLSFNGGTVYTITVGAGGAAVSGSSNGNNGNDSSISGTGITTITSIGGGRGGRLSSGGGNGGSGGGAGGSGTANQGYNGASGNNGGGGAGEAGGTDAAAQGGDGLSSSITGSSVARGGGGAGDTNVAADGGGGGNGAGPGQSGSGTANTGGGGARWNGTGTSGAGGSGVVILRMLTASYSGTTTGSPTVTTDGSDTILVYNSSGTYTG
jgi:hypothetical protein